MTNILTTLQTLLPNAETALLTTLINLSIADYEQLTNRTDYIESIVVQMVLERFSKIGNDGLESINISGIAESFIDGYSKGLISLLNTQRKIKVVRGSDNN